ncbi:MAG: PQQ-dependent sugar dehydrogenase [Chloroflexi bacterium]|nr:PQQ-dependent sugar dehydrogenase [Chloroflexota bacterium]
MNPNPTGYRLLAAAALLLAACATFSPSATPTAAPTLAAPASEATGAAPSDIPPTAEPAPTNNNAADLPDPAGFTWELVAGGLDRPTALAHAGDGSGRLFVAEKGGLVRIIRDGRLLAEPFLDLTALTDGSGYEQGLLGLAFHPEYAVNGYFFVNYTDKGGDTVVARYQASADDPDRANPASAALILTVDQPYPNHNGGHVLFGPDGYLYIGMGDGGWADDPDENGQNPDVLLAKMLRIDVDSEMPYAIPPDNPFAAGGGRAEIWALGLRNPWRYSFDRLTGDLYIADVGQWQYEEINFVPAGSPGGLNFGWDYREGAHAFQGEPPAGLALQDPVAEYTHSFGCSITGGVVYRGAALPEFFGVYLYADHCSGILWGLLNTPSGWQTSELFQLGMQISTFGEDEAGEVYLADLAGGAVYRLVRK